MASKVVYFVVDGRQEQAEFRSDDESEDVKDDSIMKKSSQFLGLYSSKRMMESSANDSDSNKTNEMDS